MPKSAINLLFVFFYSTYITAQINEPPAPCTNGQQNTCQCNNSPILCSFDVLNDYTFQMTGYQHPSDGPNSPMCWNQTNTTAHNPTWFRFTAFCENIEMTVTTSNCQWGGNYLCTSRGVQLAVFPGCNWQNPWDAIICRADDCVNNSPWGQTFNLSLNDLEVGQIYSLLVDGCCNSYCTVNIQVTSPPCTPEIDDWPDGPASITGEDEVCVGDPLTYCINIPDGAVGLTWYIQETSEIVGENTIGVGVTGELCTPTPFYFNMPGTYTLCVDAENECVLPEHTPEPNCITVNVHDIDAGEITASPMDTCPGEDIDLSISGYTVDPDLSLYIVIMDAGGTIVSVINGDNGTFTWPSCGEFLAYSYIFKTQYGTAPVVGNNFSSLIIACGADDACCDLDLVMISFGSDPPQLLNVPTDITVSCYTDIPDIEPVDYTSFCIGDGAVDGDEVVSYTDCDGGTITRTWTIEDDCDNIASGTQTITIEPVPLATFIPFDDVTVSCDMIPDMDFLPVLVYSNETSGSCEISGTITPTRTEDITNCAGTITYTWTDTDLCGRQISATQVYTVIPPALPSFINPPAAMATVDCDNAPDPNEVVELSYSNGESGVCEISGNVSVLPNVVTNSDCSKEYTYTWEFTDDCDRVISFTRIVNVLPPPTVSFSNPPSASETVSCDQEPNPSDLPELSYSNGIIGSCQVEGMAVPELEITNNDCVKIYKYTWLVTDDCGRETIYTREVTVLPPPIASVVNPPTFTSMSCEDANNFTAPDLQYSNNSDCEISGNMTKSIINNFDACGGTVDIEWTATDDCGRDILYSQSITVFPSPAPDFTSTLPTDITVSCSDLSVYAIPLNYGNGLTGQCGINGTINGVLDDSGINYCGGMATVSWTHTDDCGLTLMHIQNITVEPAPQAQFLNLPPASITLSCDDVTEDLPLLNYSNGMTGVCDISGSVVPIRTGSYNSCGGQLSYTWEFIDNCGRALSFTQSVTVQAAPEPHFVSIPDNMDLGCVTAFPDPVILEYTNGLSGTCRIEGTVTATIEDFEESRVYTWTYTNPCSGQTISAQQTLTIRPGPDITIDQNYIDICETDPFDLSTINVTDLNGTNITVTYHTYLPATPQNVLPSLIITTEIYDIYYILATNQYGCTDIIPLYFNSSEEPHTGEGQEVTVCNVDQEISLWDYLTGDFVFSGYWSATDNSVYISPYNDVNFASQPPGVYSFDYTLQSFGTCPDKTTTVVFNVVNSGTYSILEISCDEDNGTYSVILTANGFSVTSSVGTITSTGNTYTIAGIPGISQANITLTPSTDGCEIEVLNIDPPQCECPDINTPISENNGLKVCLNSTDNILSVTVESGYSAQWYSAQTGGTLLQDESLAFEPPTDQIGIKTYYVQTYDPATYCKSLRIPVTFEVVGLPNTKDAVLTTCDDENGDGLASFDLNDAKILIAPGSNLTFGFYASQSDALNEENEVSSPYNNTINNQELYVVITNTNGCKSTAILTLSVLPLPTIVFEVTDEICFGDRDGRIDLIDPNENYEFKLDSGPWTTDNEFTNLRPRTYTLQVRDTSHCVNTYDITIQDGRKLTFEEYSITCNNNGTPLEVDDDFYTITLNMGINAGYETSTYTVFYNGVEIDANLSYNIVNTINLPADESSGGLTIKDDESGCEITKNISQLYPCSSPCGLTYSDLYLECSDLGTDFDPSDDLYFYEFTLTSVSGTEEGSLVVYLNDEFYVSTSYDYRIIAKLPANGEDATFKVVDANNPDCFIIIPFGDLTPCSDNCLITPAVTNVICDDNGTPEDPDDDTYTFDVSASGINTTAGWILNDEGAVIPFDSSIHLGPFSISDGVYTLAYKNAIEPFCEGTIEVNPPAPCSGDCIILIDVEDILCFDNGTESPNDDVFTALINVNLINADEGNRFTVKINGLEFGTYMYGDQVVVANLPANGQPIIISFIHIGESECSRDITLSHEPCSIICEQTVDAGQDITLTCTNNIATLTAESSDSDGIFTWTGPNNFNKTGETVTASAAGIYYVSVKYPDNCIAIDSVRIFTDDKIPDANGGPDQTLNCITGEVILTGVTQSSGDGIVFEWTNSDGDVISDQRTVFINQPGGYYFEVIDTINDCASGKDEVIVSLDTIPPSAIIIADPGPILDCVIGTIVLSGKPVADVIFNWSTGEANYYDRASIVVSNEGIVTMTAIDTLNGCQNNASIDIIDIQDYPILVTTTPEPITCVNNGVYLSAEDSPSGPNLDYTWLDSNHNLISGENGNTLFVTNPGTYYVILTDTFNRCERIDSFFVDRIGDFPIVNVPPDINLYCGENTTSIFANVVNPLETVDINWTPIDGEILDKTNPKEILVQGSGEYIVQVTYPSSGCQSTEKVVVNVNDNFPVDISTFVNNETCAHENDGSLIIDLVKGGEEPLRFSINSSGLTPSRQFNNLSPGNYLIQVVDAHGCTYDTTITVQAGYEVILSANSPIDLKYSQSQVIELFTNLLPEEISSIKWTPFENIECDDCLINTLLGVQDITYVVEVTDINGCTESIRIMVRVNNEIIISVPNILDVNSDRNKLFSIFANENVLNIDKLSIYDRWGNLMFLEEDFKPNDRQYGWDGTYKGDFVEQGVYIFFIEYQSTAGNKSLSGDVTIIR